MERVADPTLHTSPFGFQCSNLRRTRFFPAVGVALKAVLKSPPSSLKLTPSVEPNGAPVLSEITRGKNPSSFQITRQLSSTFFMYSSHVISRACTIIVMAFSAILHCDSQYCDLCIGSPGSICFNDIRMNSSIEGTRQ